MRFVETECLLRGTAPRPRDISVERGPDAARVDEHRAARPLPRELDVTVAEQDRPTDVAVQELLLTGLHPGGEGLDVGDR